MKKLGIAAALLVFAAVFASAQNQFANGDFTKGKAGWENYNESGGRSSVKATNGELELAIQKVGKVGHACQAYDSGNIKLEKGKTYKISFDVRCTTEREFQWIFQLNGGDYRAYACGDVVAGAAKKHVEVTFTMNDKTDAKARFCLNCGNRKDGYDKLEAHSFFFDNFKLEEVK